jgi:hypothetical protein
VDMSRVISNSPLVFYAYVQVKMNRMRLRIAERLKEAQNVNAMLTTFNEVDMRCVIFDSAGSSSLWRLQLLMAVSWLNPITINISISHCATGSIWRGYSC